MKLAVVAAPLTILLGLAVWPIDHAKAAQGDRLSVSRENVNVRAGPSTNAEILLTISSGEAIVEIAAKGDWFFVDFPSLSRRGWIFGPLLDAPGTPPAQPAPTAAQKTTLLDTTAAAQPAPQTLAPTTAAADEGDEGNVAISTTTTRPADVSKPVEAQLPQQLSEVARTEEPAAVKSFRDTVVELNERAVSVAGINLFTDVRSTGAGGVQVLATDTWSTVPEAGQSSYMNALFERWQSMASGLGPLTLQILDPGGNVVMERTDS